MRAACRPRCGSSTGSLARARPQLALAELESVLDGARGAQVGTSALGAQLNVRSLTCLAGLTGAQEHGRHRAWIFEVCEPRVHATSRKSLNTSPDTWHGVNLRTAARAPTKCAAPSAPGEEGDILTMHIQTSMLAALRRAPPLLTVAALVLVGACSKDPPAGDKDALDGDALDPAEGVEEPSDEGAKPAQRND